MTKSLGLLIGQAIVVPALLVGGTPASAQVPATANASDDARLEEVIVTAQTTWPPQHVPRRPLT